jgi:serine protease
VSGTITAASNVAVDTDTNDPDSVYLPNNSLATAQAVSNPVMISGFVTDRPTSAGNDRYAVSADPDDVYAVDLAAGQSIVMEVSSPTTADLDMALYDASGALIDLSTGVSRFENVTAPVAGHYYLRVNAFSGRSNYVITIGTGAVAASAPRLNSDFIPSEAVVQFKPQSVQATGAVKALGFDIMAGGVDRPMLLSFSGPRIAVAADDLPKPLAGTSMTAEQEDKLRTLYRIKALRGRADVLSADPNYRVKIQKTPNDPYYSLQWHYPLINLPQAWDITTGTPASGSVVVAVVDTGVVLSHPDISPSLLRDGSGNVVGYDFIRNTANSNDGDGIEPNADDPGDESTPASKIGRAHV